MQLNDIGIEEAAELNRGRLIALASDPVGFLTMVRLMIQGALGRLNEAEEVSHFSFRSMTVQREGARWPGRWLPKGRGRPARVSIALDGERRVTGLPLAFGIHAVPLRLIVPMAPRESEQPSAGVGDLALVPGHAGTTSRP
ncbi:MAG: hypothetical protein R3E68_07745 [Burkholderiaceae bacterium]